ncbi:zinc finger BED domain-containing 1-like protein [Labeo rohita]|uniref:Zinc finger BED domain-containing 1-like protein n=1 Tax=Labeo rohita TaxID=84645 RepID=A0A498NLS3_LABRO|nr:zinc finger BED domain-containing 1-like protein [Labeo rohita]
MKPLLKASNILQSESSVYLGWLLPVIHQLQSKLNRLETSSQTCTPLIRALQNGLQKHFGQMMEDPELAAAAVLLTKFKTSWTDKPDVIEADHKLLEAIFTKPLSQAPARLQKMLLPLQRYNLQVNYTPGKDKRQIHHSKRDPEHSGKMYSISAANAKEPKRAIETP